MVSFSTKPTVLYLTSKKAFYLSGSAKGVLDWNGHDFGALFKTLRSKINSDTLRIILGNDLSYVVILSMPKVAKLEEIIKKANELIPEEITAVNSTFSVHDQSGKDENMVQVFALSSQVLQEISQSALKSSINIEYLCPVLSIIASSLPEKVKPTLVIWSEEEQLALFVKEKIIYGSENISDKDLGKIPFFLEYIGDHFGLKPELILTNTEVKNLVPVTNIETKKISQDILSFVAGYSIPSSDQNDILALKISQSNEESGRGVETSPAKNTLSTSQMPEVSQPSQGIEADANKHSLIWEVVLILIILSSIGFFVYQLMIKK